MYQTYDDDLFSDTDTGTAQQNGNLTFLFSWFRSAVTCWARLTTKLKFQRQSLVSTWHHRQPDRHGSLPHLTGQLIGYDALCLPLEGVVNVSKKCGHPSAHTCVPRLLKQKVVELCSHDHRWKLVPWELTCSWISPLTDTRRGSRTAFPPAVTRNCGHVAEQFQSDRADGFQDQYLNIPSLLAKVYFDRFSWTPELRWREENGFSRRDELWIAHQRSWYKKALQSK